MAEVQLARMTGEAGFQKIVALKRLSLELSKDDEVVRMLMDEARLAARLSHPNVVQVFDFGHDELGYYISMEYVPGLDLNGILLFLRRNPPAEQPVDVLVSVMIQTLRGLDYAHRLTDEATGAPVGVVHRDVSPSNVLLSPDGTAKVSDFGIARASGRLVETKAGTLKGKLPYMSPEQARGRVVDYRTDIFSAGLVLWECLAGRRAYDAGTDLEMLRMAAYAERPSFADLHLSVPKPLEDVIAKALQANPDDRWDSAGEMAMALESYHRQAHPSYVPEQLGELVKQAMATRTASGVMPSLAELGVSGNAPTFASQNVIALPKREDLAASTDAQVSLPTDAPASIRSGDAYPPEPEPAAPEPAQDKPKTKPLGLRRPKVEGDDEPANQNSGMAVDKLVVQPEKIIRPQRTFGEEKPQLGDLARMRQTDGKADWNAKPPDAAVAAEKKKGTSLLLLGFVTMAVALSMFIGISHFAGKSDDVPAMPEHAPEATKLPVFEKDKPKEVAGKEPEKKPEEKKPEPAHTEQAYEKPVPGQESYVSIDCEPTCDVYVDGHKLGAAPLHAAVTPGKHLLKMRNSGLNLEKRATIKVALGATFSHNYNLVLDP
jgi:serine/threonine-protein kinase